MLDLIKRLNLIKTSCVVYLELSPPSNTMEDKARIGTEIKKHLLAASCELEIRLSWQEVRMYRDNQ